MAPDNIFYLALTFVLLVLTAAGLWKFAPRAGAEASAKLWRDEADAQETRANRLTEEVQDLHKQIDQLTARITAQDAAIKVMQELVTGKGKVDELTRIVQTNHSEVLGLLAKR